MGKREILFILSLLLLVSCCQKDPDEEAKDLNRMVVSPPRPQKIQEKIAPTEEKITTVGDKR